VWNHLEDILWLYFDERGHVKRVLEMAKWPLINEMNIPRGEPIQIYLP
jgi:hypothetical protein